MDERKRTGPVARDTLACRAYLLEMHEALRPLADPVEIQATAARLLGEHLGVNHVAYFEVQGTDYVIERDYTRDAKSLVGRLPVESFGAGLLATYRSGRNAVSPDVAGDTSLSDAERAAFAEIEIGAFVSVPLIKNGEFVAGLAVHSHRPRAWTPEDIVLVEATAERTWAVVARARAEKALRESDARFHIMADTAPVLLWENDEHGATFVNARYLDFFGVRFEELRGMGWTKFLHPDDADAYTNAYLSAFRERRSFAAECRLRGADGQYRWMHSVGQPRGETHFVGCAVDITESKLRESNLAFLSEVSRELVSLTSIRETMNVIGARIGDYLQVARCAFAEIDETADEAVFEYEWHRAGMPSIAGRYRIADFFADEVRHLLRDGVDIVVNDVRTDSRVRAASFLGLGVQALIFIPILKGKVWRFALVIHHDEVRDWRKDEVQLMRGVTTRIWARFERARTEEALRVSEEKHRALVEQMKRQEEQLRLGTELLDFLIHHSPSGFFIVDADFRISHMNAESQARAFRNVDPAIGRHFDEAMRVLWPEPLATEIIKIFLHVLETGEPYKSSGLVGERADMDEVETYDWQLERITMPDGRLAVVCYYYDTTRLREVEQQLRDADRRKDEFLATLAHELRNPLAPIRNSLHILRLGGNDSAVAKRVHDMIERQVSHMVHLVDDLMEVSRITRGKVELRKQPIDLAGVIHSAVETSKPLMEAAEHRLTISLSPERLTLEGDAVRLAQVLTNLLNNAAKYTETGGRIWLTAFRDGPDAVVSVRDDGIGIPTDMLTKVFDLFAQADGTYSRAQGGLGIGLTLVRSLVELHGGSVEARSEGPGRGSEFVVRLPLMSGAPALPDRHARDASTDSLADLGVLVVDDNRDSAQSLCMLLQHLGADVHIADGGVAALEALRTHHPEVVLLDIGMPEMDGYEVARRARQRPEGRDALLVALTGWGQEEDRRRSREAGFDHHLVKPLDLAALQELLGSYRATH